MKKLISLLVLLSLWNVVSAQQTMSYERALELAAAKNKIVAMQFAGSDWCAPCIKLEKNILHTPAFEEYAKKFIWLRVDFPRKKANQLTDDLVLRNEQLAELYNPRGLFPLIVFVDQNEKVVGQIKYVNVSPEEYIKKIETILAQK